MNEPAGYLPGLCKGLFLFEGVDEFDGGEEADPFVVLLDGLDANGRGDVGFAGPRRGSDILPGIRPQNRAFFTRFTRFMAKRSRLGGAIGIRARTCSSFASRTARWLISPAG